MCIGLGQRQLRRYTVLVVGRRDWLKKTGLGLSALAVACGDDSDPMDAGTDTGTDGGIDAPPMDGGTDAPVDAALPPPPTGFGYGVASGDPLPDAVILWSRYVPTDDVSSIDIELTIARDTALTDVVETTTLTTDASRDWTLKYDATGLDAGTTYYFQFALADGSEQSLIGRTRTAPSGAVDRLRFGVVSCSSFGHGYFHSYRHLAERADLDAVVHLGDYIYEYGDGEYGSVRRYDPPNEIVTLDDYRRRYQHYRADADLQAVHQQHPFIVTWDDHETANNSYRDGAQNHTPGAEGTWEDRLAAAYQAYLEWMPIRQQDEDLKIWRSFSYGDLLDVVMLDTRIWGRDMETNRAGRDDPDRQLLGTDQETWLQETLEASTSTWRIIGQQVMVGNWDTTSDEEGFVPINLDQWDGYTPARARLFDLFEASSNIVVLTGDIHSNWAMELTRDPHDPEVYNPATSEGSLGVEFVGTSVTSEGAPGVIGMSLEEQALATNEHIRYVNFRLRGYMLLDVTPERFQTDYWVLDGVEAGEGEQSRERSFSVAEGTNRLEEEAAGAMDRTDAPELAPGAPPREV